MHYLHLTPRQLSGDYTYKLCLFKDITQSDVKRRVVSLGKAFAWREPGRNAIFTGGDRCPSGTKRSTTVRMAFWFVFHC